MRLASTHRLMRRLCCAPAITLALAVALDGAVPASPRVMLAQSATTAPDTARPVVIIVHGRGQLLGDSAAVRAQWSKVLQAGASTIGGAPVLRDEDVWVAWYADALDPLSPAVCDSASASGTRVNGATRENEQMREFFAAAGAGITAVLDLFDGYARDEARAIAGDLLFLGDPVRRCAAESQLENALARARQERRPVILVAHSFGSLLAYGYLQSVPPSDSPALDIHHFVTTGSLLGAPGARQLFLGDNDSLASLPPGVRAWTNIVDVRDALAYPILFESDTDTTRVENVTATPGSPESDPHDVVRYLRDPVTVRVVVGAWCEAFEAEAAPRSPAACTAFASDR